MNRYLSGLRAALLLLLSFHGQAQDIPTRHYTAADGLPSNTVYSVYRSSKGYLWFGTNKGAAVYNGLKFEKYTTFNGLPDNEIFSFLEDRKGRLWMATYNGELCFYQDGIFYTTENAPFLRLPVRIPFIKEMVAEDDGSITISFGDNTKFINIKDEHCAIYDLEKITTYPVQRAITKKKLAHGHYKLLLDEQVVEIDSLSNIVNVSLEDHTKYRGKELDNWTRSIDQGQYRLIGNYAVYDQYLHMVRPISKSIFESDIRQVYSNKEGFFFCTKNGLFLNDSLQVLGGNGSAITQDGTGNYWFSTLGNGVYTFSSNFLRSKYYDNAYKGTVSYVYSDDKNVWFIADDKNVRQLKDNVVKPVLLYEQYKLPEMKAGKTAGFLIDSNYRFYFSSVNGLSVVDNLFARQKKVSKFPMLNPTPFVSNKLIKSDSVLYINGRLSILSVDLSGLGAGSKATIKKLSDPAQRFFAMARSSDGSVWCSTTQSVYKIVGGKLIAQPQFGNLSFKSFGFYGKYLVGYSHYNQLVVCSNVNGKIDIDSLPMQNCIWDNLYEIDSSHVLIGTDNLYRLLSLRRDSSFAPFSMVAIENKFIPTDAENVCADAQNCYFFKNGAITSVDKQSLYTRPSPPTVFFTLIKSGKWYHPVRNYIKIAYAESKNVKILFSALSFSGKELVYQYSVSKGPRGNWVDVSGEEINLSNPTYGNYTVKLRAKTIGSRYSEPIVFHMTILRPYWATKWFIVLATCAVVGFVLLSIRLVFLYIIKKKERRHKKEVKFLKSEYKALNALMNPHFIFNTINNVQSLVNENNKKAANEYLRIFADLIRQNMYNISKEMISLQREIDLVKNYLALEKLRFEDKLNYDVMVDDEVDMEDVTIPPLLIQPLVENSINHGILPSPKEEGLIDIRIYQREYRLYVEVRDNGVGIKAPVHADAQSKHESYGLQNIEKRIDQLSTIQNKKIELNIREERAEDGDQWTIVVISMPLD